MFFTRRYIAPLHNNNNRISLVHHRSTNMTKTLNNKATPVAYAIVPDDDAVVVKSEEEEPSSPIEMTNLPLAAVSLDHPAYQTVSSAYAHIPETQGLSWSDDFFEDEPDEVVAVFDFDYDAKEDYYSKFGWTCYGATVCCFPTLFGISLLALVPCHLRKNVRWAVQSQHVAITRDGVRFIQEKRPTCWGASCTDAGRRSKTIPFDQITDCDVVEAAGKTLVWIPNVLHEVHIDTASSNGRGGGRCGHDLTLVGLKDPHGFQRLVWAMKREQQQQPQHPAQPGGGVIAMHYGGQAAAASSCNASTSSNNNHDSPNMLTLLQDIREELRQLREQKQRQQQQPPSEQPSAPTEEQEDNKPPRIV